MKTIAGIMLTPQGPNLLLSDELRWSCQNQAVADVANDITGALQTGPADGNPVLIALREVQKVVGGEPMMPKREDIEDDRNTVY
jgi:hypothetical protein